jgi:hypothetical protein
MKKPRRKMRHHPPALGKTTHHRVTDNEKFRILLYHFSSSIQSHPL